MASVMTPKAILVGISGASSSGKTTIARLLRDIIPNTFVLHEDDFYKPDDEIPINAELGIADWDCVEAIDVPGLRAALEEIRSSGAPPPTHKSKEDNNSVGPVPITPTQIANIKALVDAWTSPGQPGSFLSSPDAPRVCILDGFLLYTPELRPVHSLLDVRLFLLVSYAKAKQRREARDGYVTLDGFWKDPPGYVDHIVWPNYVKAHGWLFEDGNVEGPLVPDASREGVLTSGEGGQSGGLDAELAANVEWAVETLLKELERIGKEAT